jgi:hypothetical protein
MIYQGPHKQTRCRNERGDLLPESEDRKGWPDPEKVLLDICLKAHRSPQTNGE